MSVVKSYNEYKLLNKSVYILQRIIVLNYKQNNQQNSSFN